ncbi:class IIb bacteriocin, lactobin A/cerein 7B family [Leuconostoc rapi]|nr:class IIb bacteriocin, lactobin A/cerein 7B family [Leuconostoc rapi]MBM7436412.1 lactobin A/cerein 7B family class IIb bacteriocin [Leuconostoc rapi]
MGNSVLGFSVLTDSQLRQVEGGIIPIAVLGYLDSGWN